MTDEREYDDMQRDTPDRERMEMSDPERADDASNVNPDFHADRMDLRAKDDMRSTDEADNTDPESRRLSDVDPMGGEHVREDRSARDDMRARNDMRDTDEARTDGMAGTRRGVTTSGTTPGTASGTRTRSSQMEMWPEMGDLRQRFDAIQSEFIDDPRSAVRKAEELVNDVINRITSSMRDRVASMHNDVDKNADTEQLRLTMRSYRDLVDWMETRRAA